MQDRSLERRGLLAFGLLCGVALLLHGSTREERRNLHSPLGELPSRIGEWTGWDLPLEPRIVKDLGVDDYVNRIYEDNGGHLLGLYIGYYNSQRTGDTIHFPRNCLPGAGWQPIHSRLITVARPGEMPIKINESVLEKGLDRQLVLYWYQGRGRVTASEYEAKLWLVVDAITRNRTDGALVRLLTPMPDDEAPAHSRELGFLQALYPRLNEFIPN